MPDSLPAIAARGTRERGFYLIDALSDDYFVGQFWRDPDEVRPEIAALQIGQTHWTDERRGVERFA